jgi:hypothetical protein
MNCAKVPGRYKEEEQQYQPRLGYLVQQRRRPASPATFLRCLFFKLDHKGQRQQRPSPHGSHITAKHRRQSLQAGAAGI